MDTATIPKRLLIWDPASEVSLLGESSISTVHRGDYLGTPVAITLVKRKDGVVPSTYKRLHQNDMCRRQSFHFKHIVQLFGICDDEISPEPLLVSECMEGGSLKASLERAFAAHICMDVSSFVRISLDVCRGLCYLHENDFLHGDLNAGNVLLSESIVVDATRHTAYFSSCCVAKLDDFRISCPVHNGDRQDDLESYSSASSRDCGTGAPRKYGSYAFMAPECYENVSGLEGDALKAVDVYAFGLLMYQMLTGYVPWSQERVPTVAVLRSYVVSHRLRPSWGSNGAAIADRYKKVVELCWSHDPSDRPTARQLLTILLGFRDEQSARSM